MSEIKVNAIKKRNGSSITIGENGDTVTVTAGATLSGSGASLTALNGSNVATGTVANARLTGSGAITINGSAVTSEPAVLFLIFIKTLALPVSCPSLGKNINSTLLDVAEGVIDIFIPTST